MRSPADRIKRGTAAHAVRDHGTGFASVHPVGATLWWFNEFVLP
jgi:hypothetical protein